MTVPTTHIMTVNLEDYFQVGAFNRFIQNNRWSQFESRIEQSADLALNLLARHNATATFFVLGWTADKFPHIIRKIVEAGHEIGVRGYFHRKLTDMTPEEFRNDALRAKTAVEQASAQRVIGYRTADGWLSPSNAWALEELANVGFTYDSSIAPMGKEFGNDPLQQCIHRHDVGDRAILEVPISTGSVFGMRVPVAGGNYLRQFPYSIMKKAARKWVTTRAHTANHAPLVAYFQSWELDTQQPEVTGVGWLAKLRHYRNLKRMPEQLGDLLSQYRFGSVAQYLKITPEPLTTWPGIADPQPDRASTARSLKPRTPVSIVVPCFNEEKMVPHLKNLLQHVEEKLGQSYDIEYLLVDDGSSDRTWERMQEAFKANPQFILHRHTTNQGIAAAIMTGLRAAHTDTVCSMDSDGSYDPIKLAEMIPLLTNGVDLVTASPYHPAGGVRGVHASRLWLSKGCAWLYRRVLRAQLHTYTSCFRVYRRSTVAAIPLTYSRYLGIAELIGRLDLAEKKIVEHPAVLETRVIGQSKMKVVRTVLGHLKLLMRLHIDRMRQSGGTDRDVVIRSQLGFLKDKMLTPAPVALPLATKPSDPTPHPLHNSGRAVPPSPSLLPARSDRP